MMIVLQRRLDAFVNLGNKLENYLDAVQSDEQLPGGEFEVLSKAMETAYLTNNWFTIDNQLLALKGIRHLLQEAKLRNWAYSYDTDAAKSSSTIAVIMAGNIPAVGFHDFLCVLVSGHRFKGKLSSDDRHLMPALAKMLCHEEPQFEHYIEFTDSHLKSFDAIIATGSDNSARYFDYYFGRYPHIIRSNRNSLGILKGTESDESIRQLGSDVFSFFGLGCRSVSHLLLPRNYDPQELFAGFEGFRHLSNHHKYFNNYEYHKAVCIINRTRHHDNGFVLLMPDDRLSSPVGVVHYSYYDAVDEADQLVEANRERIQCVVSEGGWYSGSFSFGEAQFPSVDDFADGIDTMKFLACLHDEIKK